MNNAALLRRLHVLKSDHAALTQCRVRVGQCVPALLCCSVTITADWQFSIVDNRSSLVYVVGSAYDVLFWLSAALVTGSIRCGYPDLLLAALRARFDLWAAVQS